MHPPEPRQANSADTVACGRSAVLCVEDDSAVAEAISDVLAHHEIPVIRRQTLADAVAALNLKPACILLDLLLPDGGGIQLLRRLRSSGQAHKVAVITGSEDALLLAKVNRLNPDAYFKKPFDVMELVLWVRQAVDQPA